MKIIAHRGNTDGPNPLEENRPKYIDAAIEKGFDVEVDLRMSSEGLFLGHDKPDYPITIGWLYERKDNLWIHCKDFQSIKMMSEVPRYDFHYFWHESDRYTMTNKGIGWVFPGQQPYVRSVVVLPEDVLFFNEQYTKSNRFYAICTDFCDRYKDWDFLGS